MIQLTSGVVLKGVASHLAYRIERLFGAGGQGEVYAATCDNGAGGTVAVKWYYDHWRKWDTQLFARLAELVERGAPSARFLWPEELVTWDGGPGIGYIMAVRSVGYVSMAELMHPNVDMSFRATVTAGYELANGFNALHAEGLCYADISDNNVFVDPGSGQIQICDNDNVVVNNSPPPPILGTMPFVAPEVGLGQVYPTALSDVHSLAVLLFKLFMMHHPLEGAREQAIADLDLAASRRLYFEQPVFIFDPEDRSNRPVPGRQDKPLLYWPIYPASIRELFVRAFTVGLRERDRRVHESEWRGALVRLRDALFYCHGCQAENFHDAASSEPRCWNCGVELRLPLRLRIGTDEIVLNSDTTLAPHHLDDTRRHDFSRTVAGVEHSPNDARVWGLKNLTEQKWAATFENGDRIDVLPGCSVRIRSGTRIDFGRKQGVILK